MDTINNVTAAATKRSGGDTDANREPVSGVQGDTSQGEPYDAGNLDAPEQRQIESELSTKDSLSSNGTTAKPYSTDGPSRDTPQDKSSDASLRRDREGQSTGSQQDTAAEKPTSHGQDHPTLAADGGTFDASKPGAGRQAERILEERGIGQDHKTAADGKGASSSPKSSSEPKESHSVGERIKNKFHHHH